MRLVLSHACAVFLAWGYKQITG